MVNLNFYAKQALQVTPQLVLDKLLTHNLNLNLPEFYIQHVSSFKYHLFKNMLCLDIFSEVQEYSVIIQNDIKFVECYKTLVDCLFDFGQYAKSDSLTTEKPHGPFAKLLDNCRMGTSQTKNLKTYQPLLNDNSRLQYWVGDGTYSAACFPGNLLIFFIDLDHNAELLKIIANPSSYLAPYRPKVKVSMDDEYMFGLWKKSVVYEYLKPLY